MKNIMKNPSLDNFRFTGMPSYSFWDYKLKTIILLHYFILIGKNIKVQYMISTSLFKSNTETIILAWYNFRMWNIQQYNNYINNSTIYSPI